MSDTRALNVLLKCYAGAGNQFQITLREVTGASNEQIEAAAAALKRSGFINYYGLQRFGSGSVPTHKYVLSQWGCSGLALG